MTDKEKAPIEIERKFLIRFPDVEVLQKQKGVRVKKMRQTYLRAENGITARVRAVTENGKTRYVHTEKSRISDLSAIECEREVSEAEYQKLLKNADPERKTIEKTRYAVPFGDHVAEIDLYPFWNDRAVLEIELAAEDEQCPIPPYVAVIKEVTDDKWYKNVNLAKEIISEELE